MARIVPVTVVVPTIGRVSQLERCLESLSQCDPMPAEILIVDQSDNGETAAMVGRFARLGARAIQCQGRGLSLARNFGMRHARHATVLVTDDDCRVERSWVGAAHELMSENPEGIVTGRVLPLGDPKRVPSTKVDPAPRDYTGELHVGVLFPNNMAVNRVRRARPRRLRRVIPRGRRGRGLRFLLSVAARRRKPPLRAEHGGLARRLARRRAARPPLHALLVRHRVPLREAPAPAGLRHHPLSPPQPVLVGPRRGVLVDPPRAEAIREPARVPARLPGRVPSGWRTYGRGR